MDTCRKKFRAVEIFDITWIWKPHFAGLCWNLTFRFPWRQASFFCWGSVQLQEGRVCDSFIAFGSLARVRSRGVAECALPPLLLSFWTGRFHYATLGKKFLQILEGIFLLASWLLTNALGGTIFSAHSFLCAFSSVLLRIMSSLASATISLSLEFGHKQVIAIE